MFLQGCVVEQASTHLQGGGQQGRLKPWVGSDSPARYTAKLCSSQRHLCSCWLAHGLAGARRTLRCQPYSADQSPGVAGQMQRVSSRSSPDTLHLLLFHPPAPLSLRWGGQLFCWVWRSCIAPACLQLRLARQDICTPQKYFSPSEQTDVTVLSVAMCYR